MSKAFIAGSGIITSIGQNVAANLHSLLKLEAGITLPEILQTAHQLPVGEIKLSNEQLATLSGIKESLPRTALLSIIAAKEAWEPFAGKSDGLRIGFIGANTVGGMDLTEHFYKSFKEDKNSGDLRDVKYHECGAITELTLKALELDCWSTTISTACSSSANSIMMAAKLIENNHYDIVVAGGADSLSRFTLNGFNSLLILDKALCRPFDQNRKGLNLGEGAAYLVMGNEKAMQQLNVAPEAYVSGYANANDAHHQTASSPEGRGNQLAMKNAMQQANLNPADIDYINLHGTGTENNDASEGAAIQAVFTEKAPLASSTKAFTGHTLGAAGAVEAVFSLLSLQEQKAWAHLRLQQPIETLNWQPNVDIVPANIQHVLSNSFGFGGNCSSLIFSKT
ncbi:beta-ketoacyl-[acyl-carrier-protein] synthase family protein [Taibaiella lutea]|uniref:Beta-ketoacyl-[acyl-carrier-protein] synthase family protein n=1 Tax=Taibaiella lutea TaxID=2608001 RepID=A0A5M6CKE4_9BACT|nr:beta-ketoacyl-[acyl-carrier-protein] synthase family protein [Taibaiella lutea]KAA5534900.1 beta-ketoacyl-[acyl-carrier-protein] synthase family protein [Taibaiella lutea]